jgi:AcrR family transcriptional regulator
MSTPEQSATSRSREHTRQRLIDAAFEVFAEIGLNAASVEQITERAGFTRGAFYSNFDSKVELFFAIADAKYARATEDLQSGVDTVFSEELPAGHPITPEVVETIVTRVLGLTVADAPFALFESEFEALALRDRAIAERYAGHSRAVVSGLAGLLEGALTRIGVRFRVPAEQATRLLINAYAAAMKAHLLSGGDGQPPAAALSDVTALAVLLTERIPEGD